MSIAVVNFGRLNPPTIGHLKLAMIIESYAEEVDGDGLIYLSHSYDGINSPKFKQGKTKNPLTYEDKLKYVRNAFSNLDIEVVDFPLNGTFEVYHDVYEKGYDNLMIVCGDDRIEQFKADALKHNGQPDKDPKRYFNFDSIQVRSAGERNEDSDDATTQASASLVRKLVYDLDYDRFREFIGVKRELQEECFETLAYEMGVEL
jgi:hypothetical protein